MLIKAKVSNFISIGELQELSMISGKVRGKREHLHTSKDISLLRLSVIYGANASGKSNLISALEFAQKTIVKEIPKGYANKYNRTNENNINTPSHFEFEVKIDKKYYSYGFEIILNKSSIISEWLYEFSSDSRTEIFYRDLTRKKFSLGKYFKNEEIVNRLKIYFDDVKFQDSVLFITEMNRNKPELYKKKTELLVFNNVFKWFKNNLDINYPDKVFSNYSYFMKKTNSKEICETIKTFDTGITNFKIIDAKSDDLNNVVPAEMLKDILEELEKQINKVKKQNNQDMENLGILLRGDKDFYIFEVTRDYTIEVKTIEFEHGSCGSYKLSEESDGTRRLLELIEILFSENDNKVYVIDEIDRSLHPLLTKQFIKSYLNSLGNRKTQLIVSTHESRLLDLDLLRRDEIWFMNKNSDGHSELYSLEQYNERFDKKIDKAYLEGRYNAIPNFEEE